MRRGWYRGDPSDTVKFESFRDTGEANPYWVLELRILITPWPLVVFRYRLFRLYLSTDCTSMLNLPLIYSKWGSQHISWSPFGFDITDTFYEIFTTDFTMSALSLTLRSIAFWMSSKSKTLVTTPFTLTFPVATASMAMG